MIVPRGQRRYSALPGRDSADPLGGARPRGFAMRVVRLDGDRARRAHRHPHSQEAIFVLSGEGSLWEDGIASRIVAGDCALIERGVAHATIPDPGTTMEVVCFFPYEDLTRNVEELETVVNAGTAGTEGDAGE
jgi:quercetin dioxygenase-like cupin family protein